MYKENTYFGEACLGGSLGSFMKELDVYQKFDKIKRSLIKDKGYLFEISLSELVKSIGKLALSQFLSDIVLEFILKLSEAIYLKSCLLLNIPFENNEKEGSESREYLKEFDYFKALSTDRALFERVFVPEQRGFSWDLEDEFLNNCSLNDLLVAILPVLEREKVKTLYLERSSGESIDYYIEDVQNYMESKDFFTFKELLKEKLTLYKGEEFLLRVVYYFLSLLFLCFHNYCMLIQNNEEDDILVFVR